MLAQTFSLKNAETCEKRATTCADAFLKADWLAIAGQWRGLSGDKGDQATMARLIGRMTQCDAGGLWPLAAAPDPIRRSHERTAKGGQVLNLVPPRAADHPRSVADQSGMRNGLLRTLSTADLALLEPTLEPVLLDLRLVLVHANQAVEHVYFPEHGLASVVARAVDGSRMEVGTFGRDGMSGVSLLLGVDRTPNETFMPVAGYGHRITAESLRRALGQSVSLHAALLRFAHVSSVQAAHTALATGSQTIEQRLARSLLMAHDRLDGDVLSLTHDLLAAMLAVRRPGVTVATQLLEGEQIIKAERGRITILDRARLEAVAGGSYGAPEAEYARLIGPT